MDDRADSPFVVGELSLAACAWRIDGIGPEDQPGFGINVRWWKPGKILRPYVVASFWRWRIQAGWLHW